MRYRIKDYSVSIYYDQSTSERKGVRLTISIPSEVYAEMSQSLSIPRTREAIRLIADETRGGYILCSTGQKVLSNAGISSLSTNQMQLMFDFADLITAANGDADDIAAINAIAATDEFTIEMDWGESIDDVPSPDLSAVAKETSVKDGNDTAVSVGKEVRSEVGTGSDTAAETGTLSAVLKWTKNKVKDIYNALTDSTNGLAAIKTSAASAATDAAAVVTKIGTPASGQPSDLFAAIAAGGGGGGGSAAVPQVSVADTGSATTQQLAANTLYIFPNRTSDLTLTLGTPVQGEASEYHFIVEVGSTLPTITLPNGLTWKSSNTIAFDTYTTYEVSILDDYAIFVVW